MKESPPNLSPEQAEDLLDQAGITKDKWPEINGQSGFGSHTLRTLKEIAEGEETQDYGVIYERIRRSDY